MNSRALAAALVAVGLLAASASAAGDVTLFRVFLKDGGSLVSYGEFARVDDRVVFSMPTSAAPDPPLELVNLAADRVDWTRTDRYAESARTSHYIANQAESDYAVLTGEVARALNEVALTNDSARRLAIVEQARKTLGDWPRTHYNYRWDDVQQMLAMLDEAIADLRVSAGVQKFDLSLSANVAPPITSLEPLLPPPTPQQAIEQVLLAARVSDAPAERTSLLESALTELNRPGASVPAGWAEAMRAAATSALDAEVKTDRAYQTLSAGVMTIADRDARAADVRGIERLMARIRVRDAALGGRRPATVASLLAAVQTSLDAARQLRLARDRWEMRAPVYRAYRRSMRQPFDLFVRLQSPLEDIRSLAGSSPGTLVTMRHVADRIEKLAATIHPPDELRDAHALLVSAAQLAANAARIRREATLAADMARAWDASSAAAGALMLEARARSDIQALLKPPQLP